jgi:glycosyltransferase involved in cell wall biosynthesis
MGSALTSRLDLIIVDDGSTDGTRDILRGLAEQNANRITYVEHQSKHGARGGGGNRDRARTVSSLLPTRRRHRCPRCRPRIQPGRPARLLVPFVHEGADAVFGSRFRSADYRRVLLFTTP